MTLLRQSRAPDCSGLGRNDKIGRSSLTAPQTPSQKGQSVRKIILGENLEVLRSLPGGSANLIYIDPPFNTGKLQRRSELRVERAGANGGDRRGFKGVMYNTSVGEVREYADQFDDFPGFLRPRLEEAYR